MNSSVWTTSCCSTFPRKEGSFCFGWPLGLSLLVKNNKTMEVRVALDSSCTQLFHFERTALSRLSTFWNRWLERVMMWAMPLTTPFQFASQVTWSPLLTKHAKSILKRSTNSLHLSFSISLGQEDAQEPFYLPLWSFSCENESSLREPPSLDVATKLVNNFCADGFVSTSEPVMIRLQDWRVLKQNCNIYRDCFFLTVLIIP